MHNSYTVINASAGSGKTYRLVQQIIMICLRYPNQSDSIRTILALTFTNKAAKEMKERILFYLAEFAKDNYKDNPDLKNLHNELNKKDFKLSLEDLHWRAQNVLDFILHHYSTLNIGTIDKFNSRLIKSFSYELGLAQNFNLEIQAEPYLIEAVDSMLDDVGEKEKVSDAFMDFINYNLDNNERTNLNKTLYNSAKKFISDVHYQPLIDNIDFEWEAYEIKKIELRSIIKNLKSESQNIANKALELIKSFDINIEDFASTKNGIGGFFQNIIDFYKAKDKNFPLPSTSEESKIETFLKGASKDGKNKETEILKILPQLIQWRKEIINNYVDSQKHEKILQSILPLKVNSDIQKKLTEIEEENDLVLLSKFNILINENLKNEPSSFIYEKVGTRFQHFFFDEFQDTSTMQWSNFLPIRDHSITSDETSFTIVGDPKQSIYRFRGGESELMLDIINKKEITPKYAELENLEFNWRSAKNIVDFNNKLYRFISKDLSTKHQKIFGENSLQESKSKIEGRVKINLIEKSTKKDVFYEETVEKMRMDIQESLNNGFDFSDITILCRGNSDIFNFSQLLSHLKVLYKGQETYIKTISEKGLTLDLALTIKALIYYLKWRLIPKNRQFLVKMMYFLNVSGRIKIHDFTSEMNEILKFETKKEIENFITLKYKLSLIQIDIPQLNLYNFIEYYVLEFSVKNKETDFLLNFLEMLHNFTQNKSATLKEFIKYWDDEAYKTSIQASENVDAIQIMTIHKAKGLEFPIVFIPMKNKNSDKIFSEWYKLKSEDELKTVMIDQFPKELERYDDEIQEFNLINSYRNKIDRFCIQYVATTRPVEQLFLYLEKPSKSNNNLEIYDFVIQNNLEKSLNSDSYDIYDVSSESLKKQKIKKIEKNEKNYKSESVELNSQKIGHKSNIEISTVSKSYQNRVDHVRIGILTHEILAKINSKKDVEKVLTLYLLNGIISHEDRISIFERIENVMNNDHYKSYFLDNLNIINEREIITLKDGKSKIYRPDRLINTEKGYIIIDFKTGTEKEKDQKQVEFYQKTLELLGKKVIKTDIIYI